MISRVERSLRECASAWCSDPSRSRTPRRGRGHWRELRRRRRVGSAARRQSTNRPGKSAALPRCGSRRSASASMVVGGLPTPRADHLAAVLELALAMCDAISHMNTPGGEPLQLRIGIATGPVAGVIRRRKFSYDVWGDTVNTASRMESHRVPGRIQVTERVARSRGSGVRVRTGPVHRCKGQGKDDDASPRREASRRSLSPRGSPVEPRHGFARRRSVGDPMVTSANIWV